VGGVVIRSIHEELNPAFTMNAPACDAAVTRRRLKERMRREQPSKHKFLESALVAFRHTAWISKETHFIGS
jgi:hypothetical protein